MENFDLDYHMNNINKNGYTIVKNAFSKELANEVIKEFDNFCENLEDFKKFNYLK